MASSCTAQQYSIKSYNFKNKFGASVKGKTVTMHKGTLSSFLYATIWHHCFVSYFKLWICQFLNGQIFASFNETEKGTLFGVMLCWCQYVQCSSCVGFAFFLVHLCVLQVIMSLLEAMTGNCLGLTWTCQTSRIRHWSMFWSCASGNSVSNTVSWHCWCWSSQCLCNMFIRNTVRLFAEAFCCICIRAVSCGTVWYSCVFSVRLSLMLIKFTENTHLL